MYNPLLQGRGAPDAIKAPRWWITQLVNGSTDFDVRATTLKRVTDALMAPLEGPIDNVDDCPMGHTHWMRPYPDGSWTFITRRLSHKETFDREHPCFGQQRYEWIDRGDGLLYGYLAPAAKYGPPPKVQPQLTVTYDWRELLRMGLETGLFSREEYDAKYEMKAREEAEHGR